MFNVFFRLSTLVFALFASTIAGAADQPLPVRSTGVVTWVADGDTFRFKADDPAAFEALRVVARQKDRQTARDLRVNDRFWSDNSFLVRVANIDTEESQHPDSSRNTQAGREAGEYVKGLLQGVAATVECYDIGYWGRPICSLWTESFELGTHLIEQGYADYETGFGRHPTMDTHYRRAMQSR
ncbi:thermonuclease family protein [Marinimicrobium sp. ABcell2]|uniref:thermonuclease family protein n=1 Tax=Marinimicrobium sp. ABcell2 TaxID=3069751 RepID=UPI0027AEC8DA|nr:thermonuclease family protein [Marinimicrobium sp. ABcell2]MDQ2077416.1 thermonuclease family protein [Marinimicrobium sp. ABcell2]